MGSNNVLLGMGWNNLPPDGGNNKKLLEFCDLALDLCDNRRPNLLPVRTAEKRRMSLPIETIDVDDSDSDSVVCLSDGVLNKENFTKHGKVEEKMETAVENTDADNEIVILYAGKTDIQLPLAKNASRLSPSSEQEQIKASSSGSTLSLASNSTNQESSTSPETRTGEEETSSSGGGSYTDSEDFKTNYNDVTCWCNKPYAGRAMIQCDRCHKWNHMSCEKVKIGNDPDIYYCNSCRKELKRLKRDSKADNFEDDGPGPKCPRV